jgi:carbon storage regulator
MLVLSRAVNEEIVIGRDIRIRLLKTGRGRARLGVSAPRNIPVRRAELKPSEPTRFYEREAPGTSKAAKSR